MAGKDIVGSLAKFISEFNSQLSSSRTGSLAQVWMPEAGEDGGIVLNTQGLPYSINGVGDLLALFRCISCKYKFSTDVTKAQQMGAVGRVFTSGEPEMSNHVQRYDQHVYLRAAEAQRCRIHSTLFLPIYATPQRDACLAVFEVVLTDSDVNFAGMVGWIISCLQSEGLYTSEIDTASLQNQRLGLRSLAGAADFDGVSALESGVAARTLPPGGTLRPLALHDDGGSERQQAMAAAAAGGSVDLVPGTAAPQQAAVGVAKEEAEAANGGATGGSGGTGEAPPAKRPRTDGGSSGGGHEDGSGSGGGGLPSPTPPRQAAPAAAAAANRAGSGGGSAQPPPPQQQQQQQQQGGPPLQRQGSQQRQEGALPALLGSGSLPGVGRNGSGHHSGSGGLPSGSTAQMGAPPDPTPLVPIVAAAVQQLLSSASNPQLAALLGSHAMQPSLGAAFGSLPGSLAGAAGMGGGSNGGLPGLGPGSGMNGSGPISGPSPAATNGLALPLPPPQPGAAGQQAGGEGEDVDEDSEEDRAFLRPQPGAAQKYGQGNRVLTYDDLAAQFGYGLKEAAARLNICPTTLKRACRRLGIPRWPRRELVKHKKQKTAAKAEAGSGGAQQLQQNGGGGGVGSGGLARGQGFSTGSGPSSGGSGNPQQQIMLAAAAAAAASQQQPQQLQRPASSSLLSGLQGLQGMGGLLPPPASGAGAGGLPPDLAAAIASTLQQQQQQQGGLQPPANPVLVGQVMQLLQQHQQPQGGTSLAPPPWPPALPPLQPGPQQRLPGAGGSLPPSSLPPALPLHSSGPMAGGPNGGLPPLLPAPLLSNLGLPRRTDSKLHSVGPGMGSLDILAAADFDVSVGNMSVGNSPRLALSNLGGLSQLGLSAFDFGGTLAGGGGGPAATATGGGGATGPQNDPAFSTGAMPRPVEK